MKERPDFRGPLCQECQSRYAQWRTRADKYRDREYLLCDRCLLIDEILQWDEGWQAYTVLENTPDIEPVYRRDDNE